MVVVVVTVDIIGLPIAKYLFLLSKKKVYGDLTKFDHILVFIYPPIHPQIAPLIAPNKVNGIK